MLVHYTTTHRLHCALTGWCRRRKPRPLRRTHTTRSSSTSIIAIRHDPTSFQPSSSSKAYSQAVISGLPVNGDGVRLHASAIHTLPKLSTRVGARRLIVLLNESEESKAGADGGSGWREVTHRGGRRCVVATTGRLRQRNLTSPYASAIPVSAFAQTLTE
uniref:Uncharacterized protein n=1 Tax=Mycena chlorophos TaxID=658473 RepID=A0ABQ0LGK8_MYCCL|nr:predicted protein [Mycena chlorophos]